MVLADYDMLKSVVCSLQAATLAIVDDKDAATLRPDPAWYTYATQSHLTVKHVTCKELELADAARHIDILEGVPERIQSYACLYSWVLLGDSEQCCSGLV